MELEVRTYKNYKEMCTVNNLEVKSGKSKQLQMKEVDRLYNWHKEGNKIVIDCEKENPSEKIDGRKGHSGKHNNHVMPNNNKFGESFDKIIMDYLHTYSSVKCGFSRLMEDMEVFTSTKSDLYNDDKEEILNKHDIRLYTFKRYMKIANSRVKQKFESSLNRLQKKGIIKWNKYFVCFTVMGETKDLSKYTDYIKECKKVAQEEMDIPLDKILDNKNYTKVWNELTVSYINENEELLKDLGDEVSKCWETYDISVSDMNKCQELSDEQLKEVEKEFYGKIIDLVHTEMNNIKFTSNETGEEVYTFRSKKASYEVCELDKMLFTWYDKDLWTDKNCNYLWFMIDYKPQVKEEVKTIENNNSKSFSTNSKYIEQDRMDNIPF